MCLLTEDNNDNPIIIRPHIVFTDGRQRQPNHNTITYCVYWRKTTTTTQSQYDHILCLLTDDNDNPIITRPHIVFTDGRRQQQPNHNTTTYCGHMKHDAKKHSYNYQFHCHVILKLVFTCQPIRIIFEFRFIANQIIENHSCQVWFNLCQRF